MTTRAFILIVMFMLIGTIFTLFGYRIALEGQFSIPGIDKTVDGLNVFILIALSTALAFGAAAVLLALMIPSGVTSGVAMLAAGLTTGIIGVGMMLWFPGLTVVFPVIMVAGAVVCAQTATALGLFNPPGRK
jgi:hypothetical protein